MDDKKCACPSCSSGTHGRRDGKPTECLARHSDAPMLWESGVCPGCLKARRDAPVKTAQPHKHFFGKGSSIDDIVDKIQEMSIAAMKADAEKK